MANKIVVAGVTSLYLSVGVEEFPLDYLPAATPAWMRAGVTGSAGHIAQILSTLGDEVRLCTLAGTDPAGLAIRADLHARGLCGPGVVDGGASSLGVVLVAADGRRMGFPYLAAVNAVGYPAETFCRQASGADLAVLTNARFVRPLIRHAREMDVPVAVDAHLISDIDDGYNKPWLEVADIVFCSHERLPCPPADWVARVFARYPGCCIVGVGSGPDGCLLGLRDGTLVRADALAPRGVVNTAGAGDALFASFLHCWLATGNPVAALEAAVLHAGWKIGDTFPGASSLTEAELAALRDVHHVRTSVGRWTGGPAAAAGRDRPARPAAVTARRDRPARPAAVTARRDRPAG
jgi:sugar/nucleoside kinase (ribokinase family)